MTNQAKIWTERFKEEQIQKTNQLKLNGVKIMDTNEQTKTKKSREVIKLYGLYDLDYGILDVFQQPNDALAKRNFTTQCNTEKTPLNMFPDRFELWKIGEVDKSTGESVNDVYTVAKASECKNA